MKNLGIKITGCIIAASVSLMATGPRVTASMFTDVKNEIVAVEAPKLYSMQQSNGGVVFEIVTAALKTQNETATLTTYPIQKMVDYYLTQEKVLGSIGRAKEFSAEDKKGNIFLPVSRVQQQDYWILFNVKNADAKTIAKKYMEGITTILNNGQYHAILEKYEGKNSLSAGDIKAFKAQWKKELLKK